MAHEYRTPEERQKQLDDKMRIAQALQQAHADGVSLLAAIKLGEPPAVVEAWVDRLWNGLRENLSGNDRLQALLIFMEPALQADAEQLISEVTR